MRKFVRSALSGLILAAGLLFMVSTDSVRAAETEEEERVGTASYIFDGNGADKGKTAGFSVSCGESYTMPECGFTRKGYTFVCWNTKADGSGTRRKPGKVLKNSVNEDRTVTYYAQWRENRYTIVFDGHGATGGSMKSVTLKYTERIRLKNRFTRKGYRFAGWNTRADGKGRSYKNNQPVSKLRSKDGSTVKLSAMWTPVEYRITYVLNGGKNSAKNPLSYTVRTKSFQFKDAKRSGYIFDGWYTDKAYKNRVTGVKKGSTGKLKLYAKWRVIPHALGAEDIARIRASYSSATEGYGGFSYYPSAPGVQARFDAMGILGGPMNHSKTVSLAFQEGWETGYTGQLLDILKRKKVKACFYVTKSYASLHQDLVRRMIDEGHTVGMHTGACPEGGSARMPLEWIMDDALSMQKYMKKTFSYTVTEYNYNDGIWSPASARLLSEMGYKVVLCSHSYSDYSAYAYIDAASTLQRLESTLTGGAIYAFHVTNPVTVQMVGPLIDFIRSKGYTVGPVE